MSDNKSMLAACWLVSNMSAYEESHLVQIQRSKRMIIDKNGDQKGIQIANVALSARHRVGLQKE